MGKFMPQLRRPGSPSLARAAPISSMFQINGVAAPGAASPWELPLRPFIAPRTHLLEPDRRYRRLAAISSITDRL